MTEALSDPVAELPSCLPVFAVPGALLLPGTRIPLTVFEPRYLALVDDCLGQGRHFALVQPSPGPNADGAAPGLYGIGTLARIVAFGETGDGRYLITALGLGRFRIKGEDEGRSGYRRVRVDYSEFVTDLVGEPDPEFDRRRLVAAVTGYLGRQGVAIDGAKLDDASDSDVAAALAMTAPLSPEEKQALLEAPTTTRRAQLMITLFEMALLAEAQPSIRH